jgi:hypothetical protein
MDSADELAADEVVANLGPTHISHVREKIFAAGDVVEFDDEFRHRRLRIPPERDAADGKVFAPDQVKVMLAEVLAVIVDRDPVLTRVMHPRVRSKVFDTNRR